MRHIHFPPWGWSRFSPRFIGLLLAATSTAFAGVRLEGHVDIPAVQGRMDHLAVDVPHKRLYVASLASGAVEVVDYESLKWSSRLTGRREPQGLVYLPETRRLYVANGEGGDVEAFENGARVGVAKDLTDADNLRVEEGAHRLWVGYGAALGALDPVGLGMTEHLSLPGHPEAFALAARSKHIYVNVPEVSSVVVLDRGKGSEIGRWSVAPASRNYPLTLDETGNRLFVGTRQPGELQVFDTGNGKRIAEVPLCGDVDDLFFDAERQNIYAVCGEGVVAVVRRGAGGRYEVAQRVVSAPGARTGLFVPTLAQLFVAAPARESRPAQILVFRVE